MEKFDLEERLISFSVLSLNLTLKMPDTFASNHLSKQLIRSGTSVSLNYGEAQSAESRRDFIHKIKIVLKELRESFICLKIINKAELYNDKELINSLTSENNELISIFVKSCEMAPKNLNS